MNRKLELVIAFLAVVIRWRTSTKSFFSTRDKLVLLALAFTVITVSAITLLLILGATIIPNSIVFAKKHSNRGNNNGNDQKQKDDSNNGSNLLQTQPLILEISLLLQTEIPSANTTYSDTFTSQSINF